MRYFLYNSRTSEEYEKLINGNQIISDIDLYKDGNSSRIDECLNEVGKEEFAKNLLKLGVQFDTIDFSKREYTINNSKPITFDKFSKGERIIFFLYMASVLNFRFTSIGLLESLDIDNRDTIVQFLKGKADNGTIIVVNADNLYYGCKCEGDGYYVY